ncbi:hypothetical protein T484DRAFT_1648461, partial [Baffinella frigidus]
PETRNPKPEPETRTRNPKPETRNPKPEVETCSSKVLPRRMASTTFRVISNFTRGRPLYAASTLRGVGHFTGAVDRESGDSSKPEVPCPRGKPQTPNPKPQTLNPEP